MLQPQSVEAGAATAHGVAQAVAVSQQLLRRASNRVRVAGAQQLLATAVLQQGAGAAAQPQAGAGAQHGAGAGVQHGAGAGVQHGAGWQHELRRAITRTRLLRAHGSQLGAAYELQLETEPHEPQPIATADEPQLVQPWPTTTAAAASGAGTGAGGAASS